MRSDAVSILIPTLREADTIGDHLRYHAEHFEPAELIVVDGGSTDGTVDAVRNSGVTVRLLQVSPPGRARQLHHAVRAAQSPWLLMLHADTYLPGDLSLNRITEGSRRWGWFDCRLDAEGVHYRMIERAINLRSRLFSSPTGDQAIWVQRDLLEQAGGIPRLPLMEDVELVRRLRRREPGCRLARPVRTSARRWKRQGVLSTIALMWTLKLAFYMGVPPRYLQNWYSRASS